MVGTSVIRVRSEDAFGTVQLDGDDEVWRDSFDERVSGECWRLHRYLPGVRRDADDRLSC